MDRARAFRVAALLVAVLALAGGGLALALGSSGDPEPLAKGNRACSQTVGSLEAAASAVGGAPPGAIVCLRDGTYGELGLDAEKPAPGVTLRAAHPGRAQLAGVDLRGTNLAIARFDVRGEITVEPGSRKISILHNRISGGYFGIEAGPTTSTSIADTTIRGNRFIGPFGEDAIRLNRYHDSGDPDPYGVLIEGNEITNVRENGNHSDCLQSVWGGDGLYFRRNYLHDNRCQGFFINDQPEPVADVVVADNLMLRNAAPCDPPDSGCGPPLIVQIIGPTRGIAVTGNTIWTPENDSPLALREGPFGRVSFSGNVIYRGWSDWTGGFPDYSEREDTVCQWEGLPPLSASAKHSCHPGFRDPSRDDYRLRDGRGVDWAPRPGRFGP
jgi:Right handed beta helix region